MINALHKDYRNAKQIALAQLIERIFAMNQPLPAPAAVPCVCRHCGKVMEAKYQTPLMPGRSGYWYLTCWSASCAMNGYTFTNNSYSTVDLTPYLSAKAQT